ncbi:hypothetical protein EOPP23_08580 [Endozoicomonas sp. OPT23]|uniref:hypothetical protein n=1 Tax=Endozoicomonas sp. OPT23 TaxID=2072845 RepID=UPI00129B7F55|nr:hypothetical protein [Endozoicomonas sp. OPT23]MRI33037.1 hypothetical protein [Endozoicomonas sp. OPT23]
MQSIEIKPVEMKGWPLVTIKFNSPASDAEARQWFADMSAMLARKEPFVMVMEAQPDSQFSPEARKEMSIWFKGNRSLLGEYCLGTARIVESEEHGQRVVSDNMQKAMPFPMKAFLSRTDAIKWSEDKLRKEII